MTDERPRESLVIYENAIEVSWLGEMGGEGSRGDAFKRNINGFRVEMLQSR